MGASPSRISGASPCGSSRINFNQDRAVAEAGGIRCGDEVGSFL
jgi:hypothetical protein